MDLKKFSRFRRPEFQEKLAKARQFQRQSPPGALGFSWPKGVSLILLSVIAYFLVISEMFLVKKPVLRVGELSSELVEDVFKNLGQRRFYLVPKNHILLLTRQNLLAALQEEVPQVRQITYFKRQLPNRLELGVEKRTPLYVWQSGESYYLMDQDGVIFQKITNYDPAAYTEILIADRTSRSVKVGEKIEIQDTLNLISSLKELWPKYISQTSYSSFALAGIKSQDILVKTGIGFLVYFDKERGRETQLNNLELVLNEQIKPETLSGLSYIDLRLSNYAYYCYKDAPCAFENATSTP